MKYMTIWKSSDTSVSSVVLSVLKQGFKYCPSTSLEVDDADTITDILDIVCKKLKKNRNEG